MLETLLKHLKEQKDLGLTNDILMETFKSAIKPFKEYILRNVLFFIDILKSLRYN